MHWLKNIKYVLRKIPQLYSLPRLRHACLNNQNKIYKIKNSINSNYSGKSSYTAWYITTAFNGLFFKHSTRVDIFSYYFFIKYKMYLVNYMLPHSISFKLSTHIAPEIYRLQIQNTQTFSIRNELQRHLSSNLNLRKAVSAHPFKQILQSRRILRKFFSTKSMYSLKFTRFFLKLSKFSWLSIYTKIGVLGVLLLNIKYCRNYYDVYWLLHNKCVYVDGVVNCNFFSKINPSSIIKINGIKFWLLNNLYACYLYKAWLYRKSKRIILKVRQFSNFNKSHIHLNRYFARWLNIRNENYSTIYIFEIDYITQLVHFICVNNTGAGISPFWFESIIKPLSYLNNWQYL